ncbi:helix-turn-helix domain-containing protein [Salirhabdus salicampi]|uniref:helix-turn-helix domain-containing protein n=1 Tax=Salirhabdus salicampi TaxID=476102 RepID=UPI0020C5B312|nr:RodZ domain-containing protein [Salirhabdus salicampi]MCP8616455.1 DUF4115 domain-containing protein [Salirhabdus salicampi]
MELGEKLKQARIEHELSLDDIQQRTKIQKRYLEAIEKGDFSILPGSFYTRAFIREYADTVGLDPNELLNEYEAELPSTEEENLEQLSRLQKHRRQASTGKSSALFHILPRIIVALLIIGTIVFAYVFYQGTIDPANDSDQEDDSNQPIEYQRNEEEQQQDQPNENDEESAAQEDGNDKEQLSEEIPEEEPEQPKQTLSLISTDDGGPSSVYELTNAEQFVLTFETENESWLTVRNEKNKKFFDDMMNEDKSPTEVDVTGEKEVVLIIGRSVDLNIKINGEPFEYPFDPTESKNYYQQVKILFKEESE